MKKIHLICNSHIDPIWQWGWDEGISSVISTFKAAADLSDEFDYVFCHGESLLYETIEKNAPDLFEKIKRLVKQGKWHISGGWYLQPDCLMPNGETIVRNIAEGRRYFNDKFGEKPTVATNYDSFGHSVGLVQIMAKCGFRGYLICRPKKDVQIKYPSRFFKWIGPDGSSVIVSNSATYNSQLGEVTKKITEEASGKDFGMLGAAAGEGVKNGLNDIDYVLWGVGNHGGGPSRKDLKDISELKIDDTEMVHSTQERLFDDNIEVKGELKTSLVTCMPGCYSSMARIKQAFRKTENLFYATEKMLSVAVLNGYSPDFSDFKSAEKKLLLSTFHDILPGTCIADGEKEGLGFLSSCEKTMRDYRTDAFFYLTMNTSRAKEGEFPVFVFNYSGKTVNAVIESEFSLADQNWREDVIFVPAVYDENGREIPCQLIKENSTLNLDWRKRIIFCADLKPLSVTRFTIKVHEEPFGKKSAHVQNIGKFLDGEKLIEKPAVPETYDDTADPWAMSNKELKNLGENPVEFRLMTNAEAGEFFGTKTEISPERVIEDGKVVKTFESLYTSGKTNAVIQYRKYNEKPYVDVKVILEFADKNKLIRLKLPVPEEFKNGITVGDGPYVWEQKPDCEITFQKWVGKEKNGKIFAVINDGVYAGKSDGEYIYITLVRGAGYCIHPIGDREVYPTDRYLPRIDCGRYEYNFRLFSGDVYEVCEQAELFNTPPYALNVFPVGDGERKTETVSVTGKVLLSCLDSSEKDKCVARLYNPSGEKQKFVLFYGKISCESEIAPFEVLTAIIKNGRIILTKNDFLP